MTHVLHHPNIIPIHIYIYIDINTYFTAVTRGKIKRERRKRKNDWADDLKLRTRWPSQNSVPWTGAGGQRFLQALQDEVDCRQDCLS
jgi:hypothetical protein